MNNTDHLYFCDGTNELSEKPVNDFCEALYRGKCEWSGTELNGLEAFTSGYKAALNLLIESIMLDGLRESTRYVTLEPAQITILRICDDKSDRILGELRNIT